MKISLRQPLGFSEIGKKDNQEDRVYPSFGSATKNQKFFILCDGMGGHDNGEVASTIVSETLGHYFESNSPTDGIVTAEHFNAALATAYDALDAADTSTAQKKMGTTMTCLYLHRNGYLVAHIGDSRIYHIRPTSIKVGGESVGVRYQSSDHSLVNDLIKAGELTEEEAINFPQKNVITRAMQPHLPRRYKADIYSFSDVQAGDYFFLCCDGVLEQLTNQRLCEILADKSLNDKGKLAAIKAECDRKTRDNYTCWLIPVDKVVAEKSDIADEAVVMTEMMDDESKDEVVMVGRHNPQSSAHSSMKKKGVSTKLIAMLAIIILLAASCFGAYYYFFKVKGSPEQPTDTLNKIDSVIVPLISDKDIEEEEPIEEDSAEKATISDKLNDAIDDILIPDDAEDTAPMSTPL